MYEKKTSTFHRVVPMTVGGVAHDRVRHFVWNSCCDRLTGRHRTAHSPIVCLRS